MTVIAAVSVVLNVVLLVVVFYIRQWKRYLTALREGDDSVIVRPGLQWYALVRDDDVSGVSGEGLICEVARFSDGHAALHWVKSKYPWTTPCPEGVDAIVEIHGHEGKTRLVSVVPS